MKVVKVLIVILVVLVVLLGAVLLWVNHYLQSPEFKQYVLGEAHRALGADVRIDAINVSVFSGVNLKGVAVANPEGFPGQLLTAEAFVLRYRLAPLLRRRVEIEELSLQKPAVELVRGEKGAWNYEKLTATPAAPSSPGATKQASAGIPSTSKTGSFDITLSKLEMTGGNVMMRGDQNKELLKVQDINLSIAVALAGDKLSGQGQASIGLIGVSGSLLVRQVASPLKISADAIQLASLSGQLAGGAIAGDVTVKVLGDLHYAVHLQVKDCDVDTLLQEAHTKRVLNGKLQTTVALEGTGGLPTMTGSGRAEIVGGKLADIPLLNQIAFLLQVPALRDLKFDECRLEFTMTNNVMQTPVIRVIAPEVQITGTGSVNFADNSLNHNMTLALGKNVLANVPAEVRAVFVERSDGFLTLDFRVWGPYDSPKTDLQNRIVKGTAQQLLKEGLQKLLK